MCIWYSAFNHSDSVVPSPPLCKLSTNTNNIKENENTVIKKMMNMMETFTERILRLEERNLE